MIGCLCDMEESKLDVASAEQASEDIVYCGSRSLERRSKPEPNTWEKIYSLIY